MALAICVLGTIGQCVLFFTIAMLSALDWPESGFLNNYEYSAQYGVGSGIIGVVPISIICWLVHDKSRIASAIIGGCLWALVTSIGFYYFVYAIANA